MRQAALWTLIRHQAALYAGADCGSVTQEEFFALMQSIRYTLDASNETDADLEMQFVRGQALLRARLRAAKRRWQILRCAVSEDLQGLSYIETYLARMQLEAQILRRFDRAQLVRLYASAEAEYEEAFLNLCAPALHQAAGRALLGLDARTLSRGALQDALDGATRVVSRALELPGAEGYLRAGLRALVPRLYEAARHGSVQTIFPVATEEK